MMPRSFRTVWLVTALLAACGGQSVRRGAPGDDAGTGGAGAEPGAGGTGTGGTGDVTGGTGGTLSTGGSGTMPSGGGSGGSRTCKEIELEYVRVVGEANRCDANRNAQCDGVAESALGCGCPVAVTPSSELEAAIIAWKEAGCSAAGVECPPCQPNGSRAYCGAEGRCVFDLPGTSTQCNDLIARYESALATASKCDPDAEGQCGDYVSVPFPCGCPHGVNDATEPNAIMAEWKARCDQSDIVCQPCPPNQNPFSACARTGVCITIQLQ